LKAKLEVISLRKRTIAAAVKYLQGVRGRVEVIVLALKSLSYIAVPELASLFGNE